MKRGWVSQRDVDGNGFGEGSDQARTKALVLAEIADADLLDSLIKLVVSLQAFGGRAFVAAKRERLNRDGEVVPHNAVGQYTTLGYLVHYDHENVKGEPQEPELQYVDIDRFFDAEIVEPQRANGGKPVESAPESVPAED